MFTDAFRAPTFEPASFGIGGTVSLDADAVAYNASLTTPLTSGRLTLVSTLIAALKTGTNPWASLDRLHLLAMETSEAARRDVRNPSKTATFQGTSPTFTTDRGLTGNGTDSYVDFGEGWAASGNQYALNSAAFGIVVNGQTDTTSRNLCATDAGLNSVISVRAAGGNTTFRVNASSNGTFATGPTSKLGHWSASRRDNANMYGYKDGTLIASVAQASSSIATGNVTALRATTTYETSRIAAFWWGGGMTDAQMAQIHSALSAYLTAVGA